jgi:predicted alpha/beta hydrolase family esterase
MKTLCILIPGNPSVPGLYDHFLDHLTQNLKGHGQVVGKVLLHLGQCNQIIKKYQKISLENNIIHHRVQIQKLIRDHSPDRLVLMGHSLGSAMLVSLFEEFKHQTHHFVLLCPFIGTNLTTQNFLKKFKSPIQRSLYKNGSKVILINKTFSEYFFKKWLGHNPHNKLIIQQIKKSYYIDNFFTLLADYHDNFSRLNSIKKIYNFPKDKTLIVLAENDFWVPKEIMQIIQKNFTPIIESELKHDFCLEELQYTIVTKHILNLLNSDIETKNNTINL